MGDIEGLIDKVNELKLDENEELIDKLKQGTIIRWFRLWWLAKNISLKLQSFYTGVIVKWLFYRIILKTRYDHSDFNMLNILFITCFENACT